MLMHDFNYKCLQHLCMGSVGRLQEFGIYFFLVSIYSNYVICVKCRGYHFHIKDVGCQIVGWNPGIQYRNSGIQYRNSGIQ